MFFFGIENASLMPVKEVLQQVRFSKSLNRKGFKVYLPVLESREKSHAAKFTWNELPKQPQGVKKVTVKKICILAVSILLFAGCATEKVALSSYGHQVEVSLPKVEIDRYEAVVFPAGRLQAR